MSIRVLLVEDDLDFRAGLESFLTSAGHAVRAVATVPELTRELDEYPPHVVVLDLNLPGPDGFSAAFAMRERATVGIIVLTGRTGREDRFRGLSIGVDHYLTKPLEPSELDLIIRNLHRRIQGEGNGPRSGWILNSAQWVLSSPAGARIRLSSAEYLLIARLAARPGKPVPRTELLHENEHRDPANGGRSLDVLVFRLRKRVESECNCRLPVFSVRGVGYVFDEAVEILPD